MQRLSIHTFDAEMLTALVVSGDDDCARMALAELFQPAIAAFFRINTGARYLHERADLTLEQLRLALRRAKPLNCEGVEDELKRLLQASIPDRVSLVPSFASSAGAVSSFLDGRTPAEREALRLYYSGADLAAVEEASKVSRDRLFELRRAVLDAWKGGVAESAAAASR